MKNLNEIELDFIEYIAEKRCRSRDEIKKIYLDLKKRFDFKSINFRDFTEQNQILHTLYFGVDTAKDLVDNYAFHAPMAILRFLSYSYPGRMVHFFQNILYFFKIIFRGEICRSICSAKRVFSKKLSSFKKVDIVKYVKDNYTAPVVIDYGCGLAYDSFRIGKEVEGARIVLVDVDTIMNDFVEFRFRKHGIDFETIKVTSDNFYPSLPPHDVCIADEVMEHLKEPLRVLANIRRAVKPGGALYGDYDDHCAELYHLYTDLEFFRKELFQDYKQVANKLYVKK